MKTDNEKYNEAVQPNTAFLNELKTKLPEFFTKDGSFDLDKFKAQLKEKNVNELSEGYQLDFIGKDYARRQAGEMPTTVIVPDEEQNQSEGKDSKNLFFTGDNLEVLRHLQNNYQNKIKLIYVDPPYNTGNDGFIYPDTFEYSDDSLKNMFGLNDDQVKKLKSIQGTSSHSAWLTFMYPRLQMAKQLLTDEGVIFISIDDNELFDLKQICDEIFGEGNFLGNAARITKKSNNKGDFWAPNFDYILTYAKNIQSTLPFWGPANEKAYDKVDNDGPRAGERYQLVRLYMSSIHNNNPEQRYWITAPDGEKLIPNGTTFPPEIPNGTDGIWRWTRKKFEANKDKIVIKRVTSSNLLNQDHNQAHWNVFTKTYLSDVNRNNSAKPNSLLESFINQNGSKDLRKLHIPFDYSKPVNLMAYLFKVARVSDNDIVLDFFAGSSSTAQSVFQYNLENDIKSKFIMIQIPEKTYSTNKDGREIPTKGGKAAYDAGFKSIDQLSRERIRRAAKMIRKDNELTLPKDFDGSFKHYRVVKPVKRTLEEIEGFDPNNTNLFTDMVDGFSSKSLGIDGDASGEETILTTWLAKDGYPFDAEVQNVKFGNYIAHKVEDNRLYLINEGWGADQTKELLNQLGTHQLNLQSVVIFGYSFNIAELRELENGLKQLDNNVTLIKRY